MYWRKAALIFLIFLAGCANKPLQPTLPIKQVNIPASSIELEAMRGFYLLNSSPNEALDIFYNLYKKTKDKLFLKEAAKIAISINDKKLDEIIRDLGDEFRDDYELFRLKIGYEILRKDIPSARALAIELVKKEPKNSINHSILASVYMFNNEPRCALAQFKLAYKYDPSEDNLIKLVKILETKFSLSDQSIKYIKEWIKNNSYSKRVCFLLLNIYSKRGDIDKIVDVYKKLYDRFKDQKYLNLALKILLEKEDISGAKALLEQYDFNELILCEIYAKLKEYKKAYNIAQRIYSKTKNPEYEAKMAIYKYEQSNKKISKFELDTVIRLFESSVYSLNNPVYFNYYGYLLIDHDIDIKKGLDLVKKAYELDPNSAYIIDSIAWGYYKLKDCKQAKAWMDKIKKDTEFMKEKEAWGHKISIDKCGARI